MHIDLDAARAEDLGASLFFWFECSSPPLYCIIVLPTFLVHRTHSLWRAMQETEYPYPDDTWFESQMEPERLHSSCPSSTPSRRRELRQVITSQNHKKLTRTTWEGRKLS